MRGCTSSKPARRRLADRGAGRAGALSGAQGPRARDEGARVGVGAPPIGPT